MSGILAYQSAQTNGGVDNYIHYRGIMQLKRRYNGSVLERIELDDEIPELIPRSPIPRFRKVTLKELIESLDKAVVTENRRIKKEIWNKNALREPAISLPKLK